MKRFISVFLSAVLLLSCFAAALPASAGSEAELYLDTVKAKPGESVTMELKIRNNPGIAGLLVSLEYDRDVLTLTGTENVSSLSGFTAGKNFLWDDTVNMTGDGTLGRFTFTVAEGAASGSTEVSVIVRSCTDSEFRNVVLAGESGSVTVSAQLQGDVDGNGKVNSIDSMYLKSILMKMMDETPGSDVDGSGKTNSIDLMLLKWILLEGN